MCDSIRENGGLFLSVDRGTINSFSLFILRNKRTRPMEAMNTQRSKENDSLKFNAMKSKNPPKMKKMNRKSIPQQKAKKKI